MADAVSRITKTPIRILDLARVARDLKDKGYTVTSDSDSVIDNGVYYPDKKEIRVVHQNPSMLDLSRVIAHEDTHAALSQAGLLGEKIPTGIPALMTMRRILTGDGEENLPDKMRLAFRRSGYSGVSDEEIPAHAVSYGRGDLPGVTKRDLDDWFEVFSSGLPGPVSDKLKQIRRAAAAAEQFWGK